MSGATNGENDYETDLPDFDPIKHHNNYCPWVNGNVAAACCISTGSSTALSGWQLTVDAIETLQSVGQAQNQTRQSDSAASLYKVRAASGLSNYAIILLMPCWLAAHFSKFLNHVALFSAFHCVSCCRMITPHPDGSCSKGQTTAGADPWCFTFGVLEICQQFVSARMVLMDVYLNDTGSVICEIGRCGELRNHHVVCWNGKSWVVLCADD